VVNSSSNTLQVFNISSPAAPALVGSIATGSQPYSVAVSGSFAYVVNNSSTTLQVFNAANRVGFGTPLAAASLTGVNGSGLTGVNAVSLNGQDATFYTNASNLTTGTLADGLLSSNIPRLNVNNTFTGSEQAFAGRIRVNTGIIQKGGATITSTNDLGLYAAAPGEFIRFTTNGGGFVWYSDGAVNPGGGAARMQLTSAGNLSVVGSLSKGGGSFKIDHPLDPDNKYLYHSFVESPDMMNIYNGTTTTDNRGFAVVELPDYFEALNRDFRYQLTVVDDSENDFILAKVYRKIGVDAPRQFTIKSSMPNIEVSWQVTGIRRDAWAEKNRIPNSVDKPAAEKGKLLHPEAFGKAAEHGIVTVPGLGAATGK
jgi:hypothetical protein